MSILFAILLFSLLIFIHEAGHFVAAKLSGVQVNEFAMFMGPAIFKKQVGETLYSLRCIPIGGYCSMEGEDTDTDNPRSFQKAAWWKRLIILIAGAAMNFIAGLLIFIALFAPEETLVQPVISFAEEGCTIVSEEGFHVGDRILKVNDERVYVSSDFTTLIQLAGGDTHDFLVERNGKKVWIENLKMETHQFPDEDGQMRERLGISFTTVEATFQTTIAYAWNTSINAVRTVRLSLQMLLTGQAGLSDMTGPIGIVQIMSDTAAASKTQSQAVLNMLYFGGFIAINLAVMNMLPIPALDGGRVLFLLLTTAIEGITKKKLNPKYEGYIHGVGMVLLLGLMALIMFKDIFAIFKG